MKQKYTQPVKRVLQNDAGGLYFNHKAYGIDPKNMEKRVRVFITQLLPDIVDEAETIPDMMFAYSQIVKHTYRLVARLQRDELFEDIDSVQNAAHATVKKLSEKYKAATKDEQRREDFLAYRKDKTF